jgi:hypothetical protein
VSCDNPLAIAGFDVQEVSMKKLLAAAVLVPLAFAVFQFPASAKTDAKKFFSGKTAQGQDLFFIVENIGGVPNFEPFFTGFEITCNGQTFTYSWFFIGFQIPLPPDGSFDLNFPSDQTPFDWQGKIVGLDAAGVQSQGYAAYNPSGGVVDCGTGTVKWKATGIKGGQMPSQRHHDVTVTLTMHRNGHISQVIKSG